MAVELRCDKRLHGVLEEGVLEISCRSKFCGHRDGVVVIHKFDTVTGELIETKFYRDPTKHRKKEAG